MDLCVGVDNPKHFRLFRVALREDEEDVIDLAKYRYLHFVVYLFAFLFNCNYRRIRDQYLLLVEAVDTAAINLHAISY